MKNYTIVDIETTGFSPTKNKILEIGALKVIEGKIVDEFSELINVKQRVPSYIKNLTGITTEMSREGKRIEDVLKLFLEFLEDDHFVAHNVYFDFNFINCSLEHHFLPIMKTPRVCTFRTMKAAVPELHNHKLTTIKEYLQLDFESHRALTDCYMCKAIMDKYFKFAKIYN